MERTLLKNTEYAEELVSEIKDKKELRALDEDFIRQKLESFFADKSHEREKERALKKLESSKNYRQFSKSREHDFIIKEMRAELRKVYGVFILEGYRKKEKLLSQLPENVGYEESSDIIGQLLELHKSTKERKSHYNELYDKIFYTMKIFEEESRSIDDSDGKFTILDLACGLNPVSSVMIKEKIRKYYASDISQEDCAFIKDFFDKAGIDATVFPLDLLDEKKYPFLKKIPADVCFIFKTLDGLERLHKDVTERLLQNISAKYFAITFPTLSIGGKREIKEHRRLWLERMLQRLGWTFEKFLLENELLYVVRKGTGTG